MTMEEKFEKGLVELVTIGMEGGMAAYRIIEIMEKEIKRIRDDEAAAQKA